MYMHIKCLLEDLELYKAGVQIAMRLFLFVNQTSAEEEEEQN